MRPIFTLRIGEQRLLGINQADMFKSLEQAIESTNPTHKRPTTTTHFGEEIDRLEKWGGTEIINADASYRKRALRYAGGGIVGMFSAKKNAVYDGTTAEIRDAIDRQAYQRWIIAERQMEDSQHTSLDKIRNLARKTKLSAGFLRHKSEVCTKVQADIEQRINTAQQRLATAQGFNKSSLKISLKDLQAKLKAVNIIGTDTAKSFEGTLAGAMYHDIDNATKYFTQTFSAYAPALVGTVPEMLKKYAEGDVDLLESAITTTASTMFPDDEKKQGEQVEAMKRVAEKMTGNQGGWRGLRRRMVDTVLPSLSTGAVGALVGSTGIGLGVGLGAGAIALGVRYINNKVKYGTASRRDFERQQTASYINEQAIGQITEIRKIKEMDTIEKRITALKEMKIGSRFKVESTIGAPSTNIDLTVTATNSSQLLAVAPNGTIYAFDLKGYDTGSSPPSKEYAVSLRKFGSTTLSNGKYDMNKNATDSILTLVP